MRLELHVSMDGAAFDNGPGPLEAARILRDAATTLEQTAWDVNRPVRVRDANGNRVGFLLVTDEPLPAGTS